MNLKNLFRLAAMIAIIGLPACNNSNKIIAFDPRFAEHISAYTNGMISRNSKIRIDLMQAVASKKGIPDSTLLEDIFSFSPTLKGKAEWLNDRCILFTPEKPLAHKTFYNGIFKLGKIKKVKNDLEKFHFQFSTYEQHLYVTVEGLTNPNYFDLDWQQLEGKIKTADKEDTALLKKCLEITQDGKPLKIRFQWSEYGENEFRFFVDSVQRKIKESAIAVNFNGKYIDANEYGTLPVTVSSLDDYSVRNTTIKNENDEQSVQMEFTEPLLPTQNLNGIITVSGIDKPSFSINGNMVEIFFSEPVVGIRTIAVSNAIKNYKGYKMKLPYQTSLEFLPPFPQIKIIGNGCILPNSQGLIFPFQTINLKSVEVRVVKIFENNVHQFLQANELDGSEGLHRVGKIIKEKKIDLVYDKNHSDKWAKHVIDLNQLIKPDPGCIYRISIKFEKRDAIYSCDTTNQNNVVDQIQTIQNSIDEQEKNWNEDSWNDNSFDEYETWENYGDNGNPCDDYYYRGKAVSRNILASDLGIVFKLDENKMSYTFVSNMITTEPMPNTTIEFYDYAKQIITKGITDANGKVSVMLLQKPFLLVAKNGKQRGYMKLLDANANSLSKFDIDGEEIQKGVKGFIYAERGVWRPGDSMFINFVLYDSWKKLPANHPVYFQLTDPSGKIIFQKTTTANVHRTYDFRTATGSSAPTGNYQATVKVGNHQFTKSFHVETVKPNRLKINYTSKDLLIENSNDCNVQLKAKWLHGADAKNLKAKVYANVHSVEPKFKNYKDYVFSSPLKSLNGNEIVLLDSALNTTGEAKINCNMHLKSNAPGMLTASLVTRVFEEGGDFSIDKFSFAYSPFEKYIGLQTPANNNGMLEFNKNYIFKVACVNQNGIPADAKKIRLRIYKIEWRWWYENDDNEASAYLTKAGTLLVKDSLLSTKNGFTTFNFKSILNDYQRYMIILTDEEGGHQTGKIISFDYPYWQQNNQSRAENASMLSFSSDKQTYKKGEKVKLLIPSSAKGKALISIEKGSRVVQTFWVSTTKGQTKFEFTATADMSPNVYVHITLTQPHINTINDLPIRMYGIVPIMVDDENTHLHPIISMPDVIRPESNVCINVSEQNGKAMTYTLAMVDDGLLDLTRFKTPEIWNSFNAKEALGVKTWDMYDNVIGAYAGKLDHLISIGGDGSNDGSSTTKANRFKPVVKYLGPFYLNAGQNKMHCFKMENYVGRVRVMVVAQNENTFGNAEKEVEVNKPLMLLATMPRVVSPEEIILVPVDVFAMKDNLKEVKVELITNDYFQLQGNAQQSIHFEKKGDEIIFFKLKVAQKVGVAKIKIKATSGNESAYQEIELDVRMPNPVMAKTNEFKINAQSEATTEIKFDKIKGTNFATIELSNIPPINLDNRMQYLIQYPHGCIEQTTSSVFPQLYLNKLMDLNLAQQNSITFNIKKAIQRLQLFQTYQGGFSYWPNENYPSEFGSNYAGHFMIEAEKQGYVIPTQMKQQWVKYQLTQSKNWTTNSSYYTRYESNELVQAYRLYTLALSGNADLPSMNRMREIDNICDASKGLLALAYQSIGQIEIAKQLVSKVNWNIKPYNELSYSYGSDLRDKAMLLMAFNKLRDKTTLQNYADELAKDLNSNQWYSTQQTAYCLLALCDYYGINAKVNADFSYQLNGKDWITIKSKKTISKIEFSEKNFDKTGVVKIKNNADCKMFVKLINKGVPMIGDTSTSNSKMMMTVVYKNGKNEVINPKLIKQGTDFYAEVTLKNADSKIYLREMCLNEIFPSGWEIHNSRMLDEETNNGVRYQDIKDDRVYSYFDLNYNSTLVVKIKLNATYAGRFYMPSIYTEAMYDNTIHANSKPMWVEVLK